MSQGYWQILLIRGSCRAYRFELYFNLFLMCAWLCFYFLSLFTVLFVARAFSWSAIGIGFNGAETKGSLTSFSYFWTREIIE